MSWLATAMKKLSGEAPRERLSRAKRFATVGFTCSLGEIVDLSASGMKVQMNSSPPFGRGHMLQLTIRTSFQRVSVAGVVMWTRRAEHSQYQIGFRFLNADADKVRVLSELAEHGLAELQDQYRSQRAHAKSVANSGPVMVQATADTTNLYEVFGVARDATTEQIRDAYRVLARRHHPDVGGPQADPEMFAFIGRAYAILRDPEMRTKYDARL